MLGQFYAGRMTDLKARKFADFCVIRGRKESIMTPRRAIEKSIARK